MHSHIVFSLARQAACMAYTVCRPIANVKPALVKRRQSVLSGLGMMAFVVVDAPASVVISFSFTSCIMFIQNELELLQYRYILSMTALECTCRQPFNAHIKTAEQRTIIQHGDWYTGR